jgi:hypothetical protein
MLTAYQHTSARPAQSCAAFLVQFVLNVTRTSAGGIDSKMLKTRNTKDWKRSSIHNGRELWPFKLIQKKLNILDGTIPGTCRTWTTFKKFLKFAG